MGKHCKAVFIEMQKPLGLFGGKSQISIFIKPKSMPDIKKKNAQRLCFLNFYLEKTGTALVWDFWLPTKNVATFCSFSFPGGDANKTDQMGLDPGPEHQGGDPRSICTWNSGCSEAWVSC